MKNISCDMGRWSSENQHCLARGSGRTTLVCTLAILMSWIMSSMPGTP